jgi:hypothetical protein
MRKSAIFSVCLLFLGLGLVVQSGFAGPYYYFEITNNSKSDTTRSDLHLNFTGGTGAATLEVLQSPTGCGIPIVSGNPGAPWDITWSGACVDSLEKVTIRIYSLTSVTFSSGYWTPGNPDSTALDPTDVVDKTPLPALTDWGIGALVFAVLAAGVLLLVRRRRVAAA